MHDDLNLNEEMNGFFVTVGYICSFSYIVGSIVLDVIRSQ